MALWGGRFAGETHQLFRQFNDSLPVDWRLVQHDITGSIAWAGALENAGVLTADECETIVRALRELAAAVESNPELVREASDEDVHAWVEARLIERVGALGKKLHTGRSRNDQVATDFRLWTREAIAERVRELIDVQDALVRLAERDQEAVLPGYTHLQRAQPVLFAHWCLAYHVMLERDIDRFRAAASRANECPLGSAALAGTAYLIDRAALAAALGFDRPTANSLDAVSDRDFVFDALAAASGCALHLSRLAEDLIIYNSAEFGFIELDDAMTSGSSLMPQKKNPDALELIRGKCGRIVGSLVTIAVVLKGLPLAYNKDMQEDKAPLFDAMDELSMCLRVLPPMLDGLRVRRERCLRAAQGGYANATDLADYLVDRGVAFREAHEVVGRIVRRAIERDCALEDLSLDELRSFSPVIDKDVRDCLTIEASLHRRNVPGGTAPARVAAAIAQLREPEPVQSTGGAARE